MNEAVQKMLATPGTYHITDPSEMEPGPNGEPARQRTMPLTVEPDGKVFCLLQGNKLGAQLDPAALREDTIVLTERPKYKSIKDCARL